MLSSAYKLTKYLKGIRRRGPSQNVLLFRLTKHTICVASLLMHLHRRPFSEVLVLCSGTLPPDSLPVIGLPSIINQVGLGIYRSVQNKGRRRSHTDIGVHLMWQTVYLNLHKREDDRKESNRGVLIRELQQWPIELSGTESSLSNSVSFCCYRSERSSPDHTSWSWAISLDEECSIFFTLIYYSVYLFLMFLWVRACNACVGLNIVIPPFKHMSSPYSSLSHAVRSHVSAFIVASWLYTFCNNVCSTHFEHFSCNVLFNCVSTGKWSVIKSFTVGTSVLTFPHLAHVTAIFYNGPVQAVF